VFIYFSIGHSGVPTGMAGIEPHVCRMVLSGISEQNGFGINDLIRRSAAAGGVLFRKRHDWQRRTNNKAGTAAPHLLPAILTQD